MGGSAFPTLPIIRIPTPSYAPLLTTLTSLLIPFYTQILSPPPAPSKTSHGDLDLLVFGPTHTFTTATLKSALSAHATTTTRNSPTTSFALYREDPELHGYVQVDVHVCSTPQELRWIRFLHSYGDLWNILSQMGRYYGLRMDDTALYLCVPAAIPEDENRVQLTTEPDEVLAFYGLSREAFEGGFESLEEMWEFCRGCRFCCRGAFGEEERKARDRVRARKRVVFGTWMESVVPTLQEEEKVSREQVREEALERFRVRGPWEKVMKEVATREQEREMRGRVMRALDGRVDGREKALVGRILGRRVLDENVEDVQRFVEEEWEGVRTVAVEDARVKREKGMRVCS